LKNFVFLNQSLFIVTYNYRSASLLNTIDSKIWKININLALSSN